MPEKNCLSLCMIVKNEENWLDQCLSSIKKVADEIIIVDTGSTDRTKEIATRYNASIYDFTWTESFAEARNFGIDKASGNWILWLDADEELELQNETEFQEVLEAQEKDVWMISLVNYYGTPPPNLNRAYLFSSYRLFRNHKGIQFVGNIHEHLNLQFDSWHGPPEILPGVKIHHYGYMDMLVESKEKQKRNLYLLQKEKKHPDYNPWIDYHIASEYYRAKQYPEAFYQVNLSILGFLAKNKVPPSLLYKLKYEILLSSRSIESAWAGIENAIALYPDYVDLHFYKGLILYEKQRLEEAIEAFQHCIELGDRNHRYLIMSGCGGYLAWYFIGSCLENMGNPSKAIEAYAQAVFLYPEYQEAQDRLTYLKKDKEQK